MKTTTKDNILAYIREKHQARVHDLVRSLGISHVAVHKQLKKLVEGGFIQKIGSSPRVYYVLRRAYNDQLPTQDALSNIKMVLQTEKTDLAKRYGVSRLGIFGSFVFGDYTPESDIDIVAEFDRPVGLFQFMSLENHLSDVLNKKVDLVSKDGLKPYIKDEILRSTVYV